MWGCIIAYLRVEESRDFEEKRETKIIRIDFFFPWLLSFDQVIPAWMINIELLTYIHVPI